MFVQFTNSAAGTPGHIAPADLVALRPDTADPDHSNIFETRDGESMRARGADMEAADNLARAA